MRLTRYLVAPRFASAWCWALLTLLACDERFEFDIPGRAGNGGMLATGGAASAGAAGSIVGGAASAGSAGQSGAGTAGGCGVHPQCPAPLHCADQECWQCAEDSNCADYDLERCHPERHRCVECLTTLDCADGFVCDALANKCLRACSDEIECPEDAHGCDEDRGVCYECDEDYECEQSPVGPLCAVDGSGCVPCRVDQDCSPQRCDVLTGRCVSCRDGRDCSSGLCDPGLGTCLP